MCIQHERAALIPRLKYLCAYVCTRSGHSHKCHTYAYDWVLVTSNVKKMGVAYGSALYTTRHKVTSLAKTTNKVTMNFGPSHRSPATIEVQSGGHSTFRWLQIVTTVANSAVRGPQPQ